MRRLFEGGVYSNNYGIAQSFAVLGPVVQKPISASSGLSF